MAALSCASCPNHPSCAFVMLAIDAIESLHGLGLPFTVRISRHFHAPPCSTL